MIDNFPTFYLYEHRLKHTENNLLDQLQCIFLPLSMHELLLSIHAQTNWLYASRDLCDLYCFAVIQFVWKTK